jgi:hypothetical protein
VHPYCGRLATHGPVSIFMLASLVLATFWMPAAGQENGSEGSPPEIVEMEPAPPEEVPAPTPSPTAAPTPTQPVATPVPAGPASITDGFDSPAATGLPQSSPVPAQYTRGYVDGEYRIRIASFNGIAMASFPDAYADASLAIDTRLLSERGEIVLTCRAGPQSGYRLTVDPSTQRFRLRRVEAGGGPFLINPTQSNAIARGGAANRLELSCLGSTIAAKANGEPLFSLQDAPYASGEFHLGLFSPNAPAEVAFDNVVIAVGAPATPSRPGWSCPAPIPQPTDVSVTAPGAGLDRRLAAFSGVWYGRWQQSGRNVDYTWLAVEQITATSADVAYRSGTFFQRYTARIRLEGQEKPTLEWQTGLGPFIFFMREDLNTIEGFLPRDPFPVITATLTRCAFTPSS